MLSKVLLNIYKDPFLNRNLGFKGGTCAMFFYGLDRLSVDLDFDLLNNLDTKQRQKLIDQLGSILKQFGKITDFADKQNTILFEIKYQDYARRLKVEISKRKLPASYQIKNFLGENIPIMKEEDLFAHKLLALLNRKWVANRDIYDIRFFLQKGIKPNPQIIKKLSGKDLKEYLQQVKKFIENYDFNKILYGLGELLEPSKKHFAKTKMKSQILGFLDFYLQ